MHVTAALRKSALSLGCTVFVACLTIPAWAIFPPTNTQTTTTSTTTTVRNTTTQSRTVDTYSTRIVATLNNGANTVYDQTFPVAYTDPTVQSALTAARQALAQVAGPSAAINGPVLTSSTRSQVSTSTANQDTPISTSTQTTITTGPASIMVGPNQSVSYFVPAGTTNTNTNTDTLVDRVVVTTTTFLTSQTYAFTATSQSSVPTTPAPPSLYLGLTGLAGAGLYALRRLRAAR